MKLARVRGSEPLPAPGSPPPDAPAGGRTRRVLLGAAALFGARGLSMVCTLVTVGVVARGLDPASFGLWSVMATIVGFAGGLDFGLGQGLKNRLAVLAARPSPAHEAQAREVFMATLAFLAALALAGTLLVALLSPLVPWADLLGVRGGAVRDAVRPAVTFVVAMMLVNLPLALNLSGFLAYQHAHVRAVMDVVQALFMLAAGTLAVRFLDARGVIEVYYGTFNVAALAALVMFLAGRGWRLAVPPWRRALALVRSIAGQSTGFWVMGLAALLLFSSDPIIASRVAGLEAAGTFSVLQRIFVLLIGVHFTVLNPLWPAYTNAAETGDWAWVRATAARARRLTLLLFGGGGLAAVLLYGPVVRLWTGRAFHEDLLVALLAAWSLLYAVVNVESVLLNALGRVRVQAIVMVAATLLHFVLSSALGARLGLAGVVLGSILSIAPIAASNLWQVRRVLRSHA